MTLTLVVDNTSQYQRWRQTVRQYPCPTCHAPPHKPCKIDTTWLHRDYHLRRHTIARRHHRAGMK